MLSGSEKSNSIAARFRVAVARVAPENRSVAASTRLVFFASGGIPAVIPVVVHAALEFQDEVPSVPPEVIVFPPRGSRGMRFLHPLAWTSQVLWWFLSEFERGILEPCGEWVPAAAWFR